MHLSHSLLIERPRAEVFDFITHHVPKRYREMASGHERFDVLGGGPVQANSQIDCRERASNQEVHHTYRVRAFEPGRHLYYASTPSLTFIHLPRRVIEGQSDTHVYYDLYDVQGDAQAGTQLDMLIVIQLPHLAQKWMAVATGSARLWGGHQREELAKLKRMIEAEPARRARATVAA